MSSLGYHEIGAYQRGELTLTVATERFKVATLPYIRRQLTWFRPDARIHLLDAVLPTTTLANANPLSISRCGCACGVGCRVCRTSGLLTGVPPRRWLG